METRLTRGLTENPEARALREEVFIKEQGFTLEFDETDKAAFHLALLQNGRAVAVGRTFPKENGSGVWVIGRVAVAREYRGTGLGARAVELLEKAARENGAREWELSAQTRARGFYEKLGYRAEGEIYRDEFCPHITMRKKA